MLNVDCATGATVVTPNGVTAEVAAGVAPNLNPPSFASEEATLNKVLLVLGMFCPNWNVLICDELLVKFERAEAPVFAAAIIIK